MTTRYRCPISNCGWSHNAVVTGPAPDWSTDLLMWTPADWAAAPNWVGRTLATVHVINAHLVTHSPVQWMTEIRRERERAEAAERRLIEAQEALESAAVFTDAAHPIHPTRLPSRAELDKFITPEGRRVVDEFVARHANESDDFDVSEALNRNLDEAVAGMVGIAEGGDVDV